LDTLEALLGAEHEDGIRCDVLLQVADQLRRAADTLRQWAAERPGEESSMPQIDRAPEVAPRLSGVRPTEGRSKAT
jgi:hypothetical protein